MKRRDLIARILAKRPDLTREKVEALIASKVKLSPLINEEAAAYMVASELGVDLGEFELITKLKIENLVPGMRNVSLVGRVIFLYPPQTFTRLDGNLGKVVRGTIADDTGVVNIVLWNDKAELVERREIIQDQIVKIIRGYTRKGLYGEVELHVNSEGDMLVSPIDIKEFPKAETFFKKIGQITDGDRIANIFGVVDKVFPVITFGDERRRGRVLRVRVYDETGKVLVVFWDDWVDRMRDVVEGKCLQIVGGKPRRGKRGIEIHADKMTNVTILEREMKRPLTRMRSLKEDMHGIDVLAKVVHVEKEREVRTRDGRVLRLARLLVGDQSGVVSLLFWGKKCELVSSIKEGDVILFENCRVRRSQSGILELVFTDDSGLVMNPDTSEAIELSQRPIVMMIKNLRGGLLGTLEVTLVDNPDIREVYVEGSGLVKVATLKVMDGTGTIEVSLWRDLAEKVKALTKGDKIRMYFLRIIERYEGIRAVSSRWTRIEVLSR
jgi:replication factor A1